MAKYKVSETIDKNKVFILQRSELLQRIDPIYYNSNLQKFIYGKYKGVPLSSLILKFKSGFGAGKQDQANDNIGIIQIRPTNIDRNGILKFDKNVYLPFETQAETIDVDDVLFNNTNSQELVGKTTILKENQNLFFSNHITKLVVNKSKLIPDFLWIILNVYQENKIFYSICTNWNNQSGVGLELLKSLKIPLPPKDIQQQIVEKINNAYRLKQQKEAQAKKLLDSIDIYLLNELGITLPEKDNSLQSRIFTTNFSEVSGGRFDAVSNKSKDVEEALLNGKYSTIKLSKLIKGIKTGTTPHNSLNPYVEVGIPFLRNSNLQKGELDLSDIKFIKEELAKQLTYSKKNEIIVCIAGTVGESAINTSNEPLAINQNITALEIDNVRISTKYLNYFLNTELNIELTKRLCSVATILYLNNSNLLSLNIPLPPQGKQTEIANHIHDIRTQAMQLQKEAIAVLEEAKKEVEKMILG